MTGWVKIWFFELKFCSQTLNFCHHSPWYYLYFLKYFHIFLLIVEAAILATRTSGAEKLTSEGHVSA